MRYGDSTVNSIPPSEDQGDAINDHKYIQKYNFITYSQDPLTIQDAIQRSSIKGHRTGLKLLSS